MITQRDLIYRYIKDFGSITPLQAFADLGITKLATRVSEMRRDGIAIQGEWQEGRNRYGKKTQYMKYKFAEV